MTAGHPPTGLPPGLSLNPPIDLTPEQALAVFELVDTFADLLEDLRQRLWILYGQDVQHEIQRQRQPAGAGGSDP
jgi:hypothetical protein